MILDSIHNIKKQIINQGDKSDRDVLKACSPDYLQIINLGRIVFFYVIQFLLDKDVKINMEKVSKFLKHDTELDKTESKHNQSRILPFHYIKSKVDTTKKIGTAYLSRPEGSC